MKNVIKYFWTTNLWATISILDILYSNGCEVHHQGGKIANFTVPMFNFIKENTEKIDEAQQRFWSTFLWSSDLGKFNG